MSATKDEKYLIKLYELALKAGDPTQEIDRYKVGKEIGQNPKGVDAIVKNLMQSNFLKKGDEENFIYLTEGGLSLIKLLRTGKS